MKVLVFGGGARNHAICDKYGNSQHVDKVYFCNGSAGVKHTIKGKRGLIEHVQIEDFDEVARFCLNTGVDLVDIGSENPLSAGLVNVLNDAGIATVGPRKEYCILESDRAFTHELLKRIGVPLPEFRVFDDPLEAKRYVKDIGYQVVVKANGLAAGKGAIVCDSVQDALDAIDLIMVKREFGDSGKRVVIEERKHGTELSFFVYLDGKHRLPMRMFAQDYKRAFDPDDDENIKVFGGNPNTGGTGSYCPHKLVSPWLVNRIIKEIVNPTVDEIYSMGWDYRGIMYFGLNLDPYENLDVFEINVRFGDPEAQVLLRKLSTDLYEIGRAVWEQKLDGMELKWNDQHYVNIVAMEGRSKASRSWFKGYPGRSGDMHRIVGIDELPPYAAVYFGGVTIKDEELVTLRGRVLNVICGGKTLEEARERAYESISKIRFIDHRNDNKDCNRYRKTIGL
jgi:phosphoribosylamine--glycine ligase